MNVSTIRPDHAIVVGASIAGLLAATTLSSYFRRVTVLERDSLRDCNGARRGAPQGRHVHVLLVRGQRIMESLLPGLTPSLIERGAVALHPGRDFRWHHFGRWKAQFGTQLRTVSVSRPTLEQEVRRRVAQLPNVEIVNNAVVTRYALDWEHARVSGAFVRTRGPEMPEELLNADLVVDASGRGSVTPRLLKELGYLPPPESSVRIDFGYASRIYKRPPGARNWQAMYVVDPAPDTRGGLIFPIEGDRWLVTLLGYHGDHPPTSEEGFLDFARSLPVPDIFSAICRAVPLTDPVAHGFPATWRRHYERLKRFPSGLIVMGDALCSLNPVYGQGMTVAAMEAELLGQCLARTATRSVAGIAELTEEFRMRAAEVLDLPWQLASGEDLRFPQTVGKRPLPLRFMHWYTAKLHEAAGASPLVARRFSAVVNMVAPRSDLFRWEVIREALRAKFARPPAARPRALAPERRYG